MFPGIFVAHITDRLDFNIEKVSSDYKTAALEQVLEIPMKSELTDNFCYFNYKTTFMKDGKSLTKICHKKCLPFSCLIF